MDKYHISEKSRPIISANLKVSVYVGLYDILFERIDVNDNCR